MIRKIAEACMAVVLTASSAAAQEPPASAAAPPPAVVVSIDDTAAPPEWELSVPVSVQVVDGVDLGRLSMRLVYPATALRYVSVKATETLTGAGFDVIAGTPAIDKEKGSVAIEIRPSRQNPARLPSGRVAVLLFKVSVDAEEKSWSMTAEDVGAWGSGPNGTPVNAAAQKPATFTVASAGLPIFACFFYMH